MNPGIQTAHSEGSFSQLSVLDRLKVHGELLAAAVSGLLIVIAWLLDKNGAETTSIMVYISAYMIGGFAKAKEGIQDTIHQKEFNVELLMILAAIGSAIIGYWAEGAILIFIFALSGALETYTMNKSQKEISSLMKLQPEEAWLIKEGDVKRVHVSELDVGDLVLIKPGERVPSDGKIVNGITTVDEAAITGESLPVTKGLDEEVYAGTLNMNGSITMEVTKPNHATLFQKIIELVQSAQSEKSPSQLFIERFEGRYVKVVLLAVFIMMFLPHYVLGWTWNETFYRAMILLVVASPCALVASIMPATLSAVSNGARKGILFKGGNHLEQLAHVKAIAFDKTGTLTKGQPEVTDVIVRNGMDESEVLQAAGSIEWHSNHPLAKAIVAYTQSKGAEEFQQVHQLKDIPGKGIQATINQVVWKMGNVEFMDRTALDANALLQAETLQAEGKTIVYIQKGEHWAGMIALTDVIRRETIRTIRLLKKQGVYSIMLTGDNKTTAQAIAAESKIDDYIAGCLPENKVKHISTLQSTYDSVAMVGDGINDAPALVTANVGIAIGNGTDVALETADVVLMKNDLSRIPEAIQLSKRMNRIIKQNIYFSIGVIFLLIMSNFFQFIDLPLGVIGHEGSTILVILNGLRLLKS
ncbi:heavy metal translocating P-type ATPase [Siminovitchia sediminis]|uniref:Heavy metal translocating P-type ATPase n=1 Tax=Siminovitchia sediminis TaxID=1274353 RepID=A0ABW4KAR5_9BACI